MTKRTPAQYDWKNALFNDRRLPRGGHFTSPRRSKITHVTLHHMTIVASGSGSGTTSALEGCYRTWTGSRQASANYGISGNQVWQYVSDNDAAWADANSTSNHSTLSIEHANSTAGPKWEISDETLATSARLIATLHHLYGLGRPSRKTVKVHRDYFATSCPGPYMMAHLSAHIAAAARIYDNPNNTKDWFEMATEDQLRKIVRDELARTYNPDDVPIVAPVGTEAERKENPKWKRTSVLSVILREVVTVRNMLQTLIDSQSGGGSGKA